MATGATGGGAPAITGTQAENAGMQLATPSFGNGEKTANQGRTNQVLAGEEVSLLKQGIAQDLERLGRDPAVVAAPIQQQQQQPVQNQPQPEVIVLPRRPPEPVQIEPEPEASQTIEEAADGLVSQAQEQALQNYPSSQSVSPTSDGATSSPAGINMDPAPDVILNEARRVGKIPDASTPVAPKVVVGPVTRPVDVHVATATIAAKEPTLAMQPVTTEAVPHEVTTSPSAIDENGLIPADTSEPSDNAPIVKAVVANLRSTRKQLAVANQAQKLLSARKESLEMQLGQAREAVDEQEMLAAKSKADAAVGLNIHVKSMISTSWKPWTSNDDGRDNIPSMRNRNQDNKQ